MSGFSKIDVEHQPVAWFVHRKPHTQADSRRHEGDLSLEVCGHFVLGGSIQSEAPAPRLEPGPHSRLVVRSRAV